MALLNQWMERPLIWLYQRLTRSDSVDEVDAIFVMAGRIERKAYGLDLYRSGIAPHLILSVGRFEVSKMKNLQIPGFAELIVLRDKTPPDERHFFMDIDSSGSRVYKATLPRWNTYGETLALRGFLEEKRFHSVMVISTDIHLRRVSSAFIKVFRHRQVRFRYCAVPLTMSSLQKDRWWSRPNDRQYVLRETIKLIGYRVILALPGSASRILAADPLERLPQ